MNHKVVFQNQTRTAQSEVGKIEEKLREANKLAAQAKDENTSLQQCLVTKLLNDSVIIHFRIKTGSILNGCT